MRRIGEVGDLFKAGQGTAKAAVKRTKAHSRVARVVVKQLKQPEESAKAALNQRRLVAQPTAAVLTIVAQY